MDKTSTLIQSLELGFNTSAQLPLTAEQKPEICPEDGGFDIHDWSSKNQATFDTTIFLELREGPGNFVIRVVPEVQLSYDSDNSGNLWFIDRIEVYTGDVTGPDFFLESYALPGSELRSSFDFQGLAAAKPASKPSLGVSSKAGAKSRANKNTAGRYYSTVQQNCDGARLPTGEYCDSACRWRTEFARLKGGGKITDITQTIAPSKLTPEAFKFSGKAFSQNWYFSQVVPQKKVVDFYIETRLYLRQQTPRKEGLLMWCQKFDVLRVQFDAGSFTLVESRVADATIKFTGDAGEKLSAMMQAKVVKRGGKKAPSKASDAKSKNENIIKTVAAKDDEGEF